MALVAVMATKTWALDANETAALLSFYMSNHQGLNLLPIPWGSDMSKACGDANNVAWGGITCDNNKEHITAIALDGAGLMGTIPDNIDGLSYLKLLRLSTCSLSGTIPASISHLGLSTLNLKGNNFRLCDAPPPTNLPSTCDVSRQNAALCVSGCCGCNAEWQATGCVSDVPACAACTGQPVHAPGSNMELSCSNGRWVLPSSFTGPLVVQGRAIVGGDYTLPRDQVLIFVGWDAQLNVTGKASIRGSVVMYLTEPQARELRLIGSLNRKTVTYLTAGIAQTQPGSSVGRAISFSAHTNRACQKPYGTVTGDSTTYSVGLRWANTCNTWWIILLCVSPSILGGLIAVIVTLATS